MSRLVRRLFARVLDTRRPSRVVRRAADLRAHLLVQALEDRQVPATFSVFSTADNGAGTLRQAILDSNLAANAPPVGTTNSISFALTGTQTIAITSGQLTISQPLTITGFLNPANLIIDGTNSSRIFNISDANSNTKIVVNLSGMTVRNGAINPSALNSGVDGAGVFIDNENVTLDRMIVTNNAVFGANTDSGGGIASSNANGGGLLTLKNSIVSGNVANGRGGGIYFLAGALNIDNTTITGNQSNDINGGGGIYFNGTPITAASTLNTITGVRITNTTIDNNTASSTQGANGGGIEFFSTTANFTNSVVILNTTIANNSSQSGGGGIGIDNLSTTTTQGGILIQSSTIVGNTAGDAINIPGSGGGGIAMDSYNAGTVGNTALVKLQSSIVSGNTTGGSNFRDISILGQLAATNSAIGVNAGFILTSPTDPVNPSVSNLPFNAALGLGTLASNGGVTQTIALASNSLAIDHGANPGAVLTDQRGNVRQNGLFDIGAVEQSSANVPVAAQTSTPNVTTNGGTSYDFTVTYTDATSVNVASLDNNDVRVTGPNGFSATANFISVSPTTNGSPRLATYRLTAPSNTVANTWDASDFGNYTISVVAGQVFNTTAQSIPASTLGIFQALTPSTLTVTVTDAGTAAGSFRAALTAANNRVGSNDIITFGTQFNTPVRLDLTTTIGSLVISDPVTIQGPGASRFILNGATVVRPLTITDAGIQNPPVTLQGIAGVGLNFGFLAPINVSISGMTVTNGSAGVGTWGGGVFTGNESVVLDSVVIGNSNVGFVGGVGTSTANDAGGGVGTALNAGSLTVRNSTITGNSSGGRGGGIYTGVTGTTSTGLAGTLSSILLDNNIVTGNTTTPANNNNDAGGGIHTRTNSTATVRNSTISGNFSGGKGAGVYSNTNLFVDNSTVSGNVIQGNISSTYAGGGVADNGGGLTVRNSTISGNATQSGKGGGIYSNGGSLRVDSSTISGNTVIAININGVGGGIGINGATTATIINSTIANNAQVGGLSGGGGVGIYLSNATLNVLNSTITGNSSSNAATDAGQGGGGLALVTVNTTTTTGTVINITSSIISNNTSGNAFADISEGSGPANGFTPTRTTLSVSNSAIGNSNGFSINGTNTNNLAFGLDLKFDTAGLKDNGGAATGHTQTIALQTSSPAIDKGSNPTAATSDQRGAPFVRTQGAAADIGAFEVQGAGGGGTAPTVSTVVVNGGASQKSEVTSITLTFSTTVTVGANAFTLRNLNTSTNVGSITATGSGTNTITLTGFSGASTTSATDAGGVVNHSLSDGRYLLTVTAGAITNNGTAMVTDFTFQDSGSTTGNQLYRLYGDGDSNRVVNAADLNAFRLAFGTVVTTDLTWDSDLSGVINAADLNAFRANFGNAV